VWEDFEVRRPPAGWITLDENTWNAMLVWVAGPANACRTPAGDRHLFTSTVCSGSGSAAAVTTGTLSDDDLRTLDDDTDRVLAGAGIPPRPRGYDWHLRPPAGVSNQDNLAEAVAVYDSSSPKEYSAGAELDYMSRALRELYADIRVRK
jgi:hypothetical protein